MLKLGGAGCVCVWEGNSGLGGERKLYLPQFSLFIIAVTTSKLQFTS